MVEKSDRKKKAVDFHSPRTRRRTTTKIQQRKKNPLEIGSFKPQKKRNSPAIKQANKKTEDKTQQTKQKKNKTPQPSLKLMCKEENE
jgi:hypothetical protein